MSRGGGGLLMIGGYYSFQGINGGARYHRTPVEEVLPVSCLPYDDRVEVPEGFRAELVAGRDHPILAGLAGDWPPLLGLNEVTAQGRADVELLATAPADEGGHPLLVAGTLRPGPHAGLDLGHRPALAAAGFVAWQGYARLWRQALAWVCGQS